VVRPTDEKLAQALLVLVAAIASDTAVFPDNAPTYLLIGGGRTMEQVWNAQR
jgi:hypothetical protein